MISPAQRLAHGYPGLGCCEERERLLADKIRLLREYAELEAFLPCDTGDAEVTDVAPEWVASCVANDTNTQIGDCAG